MLYNKYVYINNSRCQYLLINVLQGRATFLEIVISLMSSLAVIFLTLPIHEWAHGFVSTKLGDPTPRYQGRLTLNPMAHIDWIGALGILLFGIGWAKPVQVNARYYKNAKWGMAAVALAGPLANIIVAFASLLVLNIIKTVFLVSGIFSVSYNLLLYITLFFYTIAQINVYLAVFNLIPVPPFDGSRILFTFLPQKYYFKVMQYERYIFIGILLVLYTGVLDAPIAFLSNKVLVAVAKLAALPFGF